MKSIRTRQFVSVAHWRTRFLKNASVEKNFPSARFLSEHLSKHSPIMRNGVGLLESQWYKEMSSKAFQQLMLMTTTHMSEKRFRIWSRSWASERGRQEGTWPHWIWNLIFSYSFFIEKCFSVSFELVKVKFNHGCPTPEKMFFIPTWKKALLPSPGKSHSDAKGRAEN